jgi:hypothetical protein
VDDHLSGTGVTARPQATYPGCSGRAALSLLGLAPDGVYLAEPVTRIAGGLLPHRFTLACSNGPEGSIRHRRSALCCTIHRVAPPGCYPASCPVESGLSSTVETVAIASPARTGNASGSYAFLFDVRGQRDRAGHAASEAAQVLRRFSAQVAPEAPPTIASTPRRNSPKKFAFAPAAIVNVAMARNRSSEAIRPAISA